MEIALKEDPALQYWQEKYDLYIKDFPRQAYDKFRIVPEENEHDIDPEILKTFKKNEANGI